MKLNDVVQKWFTFAANDLRAARHLFGDLYPKLLEIACYHAHQAAEKALKGFLVLQDIDPPKIHDVKRLCEMAIEKDATFQTILVICERITPYGVATRYPDEIEVDEAITQATIAWGQSIYDFCTRKVPKIE
jgi:HEPN domain-containing protein